jgi:alkylation response protein AidB-like acyl-CoA dehydrogenase
MTLHTPYRHPALDALLPEFLASAPRRDLAGGHAAQEKDRLRQAGLLNLSIPKAQGGEGLAWPQLYQLIRHLAVVDSALAHVLAFHHLQVATVLIYGQPAQHQALLGPTVEQGLWWGNAMNPLDTRLAARPCAGGYRLSGAKAFCSGTRGSQWMTLSAHIEGQPYPLLAVVPTEAVKQQDDWNPIGQRQTDSISVVFEDVFIPQAQVLKAPDAAPSVFHSLRNCFAQLVLVNLYLGIAEGALSQGCAFVRDQARPWITSGVAQRVDDPFQQNRVGLLDARLSGATAATDRAGELLQLAYARGAQLTADERGEVSVAIGQAKVLAHQLSLEASQELFEMTGAKGTDQAYGFDRFWRNSRTHTLHDPIDYKLNQLGRWRLKGEWPNPQYYA